jgi:LysM repeat protein
VLSTADNEALHEAPPAPSAVYRVKQGDTLYSIAKRNGTTVQELCRVNEISERRPIYAGQRLRLR